MKVENKRKYSYGYAVGLLKSFRKLENKNLRKVEKNLNYIIRMDGIGMTKAFKVKHQPIQEDYEETLNKVVKQLLEENQHFVLGYRFSDEISLLISTKGYDDEKVAQVNKILRSIEKRAAELFNQFLSKTSLIQSRKYKFDYRILKITDRNVKNYFESRQAFAIDRYLMMTKAKNKINYKLHTFNDVVEELEKLGIDYFSLPIGHRNGVIVYRKENVVLAEGAEEFEILSDFSAKYFC